MTQRQKFSTILLAGAALFVAAKAPAQLPWETFHAARRGEIPFNLPTIPYGVDALEPYVRREVLAVHHDLLHSNYVRQLNKAIGEVDQMFVQLDFRGYFTNASGETLVMKLNSIPEKVRSYSGGEQAVSDKLRNRIWENACGHYNHSLFWQMMKKGGGGQPTVELAAAINKNFGGFAGFKDKFLTAVTNQAGNGWVWLTLDGGTLKIETSTNEDNPLVHGRPVLLGLDLWDHAYRPQYTNRADYVRAWWNVVNWDFVAERYEKLSKEAREKKQPG